MRDGERGRTPEAKERCIASLTLQNALVIIVCQEALSIQQIRQSQPSRVSPMLPQARTVKDKGWVVADILIGSSLRLNNYNGMKAARLAVYLSEVGRHEMRIEIAREIMAQNMNFSPAWLLALLHKNSPDSENTCLTISHFEAFLTLLGLPFSKSKFIAIFQYFDSLKTCSVKNKDFVDALLPVNPALRKAVSKRIAEDLELTKELKYCLRRFFQEIEVASLQLREYETTFISLKDQLGNEPSQPISKTDLKSFLKKYGKIPTERELNCIAAQIEGKRLREISPKVLDSIIVESLKQSPSHSAPNQNLHPNRDDAFTRRKESSAEVSHMPKLQIAKTVSILQNQPDNGCTSRISGQANGKEEDPKTPINLIHRGSPLQDNFEIHYSSRRRDDKIDASGLRTANQEMQDEIDWRREENRAKVEQLRQGLKSLGSR